MKQLAFIINGRTDLQIDKQSKVALVVCALQHHRETSKQDLFYDRDSHFLQSRINGVTNGLRTIQRLEKLVEL
jgi:hypothetical protein